MIGMQTLTLPAGKPASRRVVALVVLAALVLAPVVAGVGVGTGVGQSGVEPADLAVDQPHYVSGDVSRQSANGTTVYEVSGAEIELVPQNFDADRVTGFGTTTGNGSLEYDRAKGEYVLSASETGTYELYWIVEETVVVDDGTGNQSDNSTSGSDPQTATRERRYEARVRVTGGLDLVHRPASSIEDQQTAASNWREFNSTLHQRGLVGASDVETTLEEMIAWYELRKNPQEALTGGVIATLIILVSTVGGLLIVVVFFGYHARAMDVLRRELQKHEALKAEEGAAKDAVADLQALQNQQALQNLAPQDLSGFDDIDAGAMQDAFGETVHDAWVEFLSATQPRHLIADRLRAMGAEGWVAVVDERDANGNIMTAHLEHRHDLPDGPTAADGGLDADGDDLDVVALDSTDETTLAAVRDALDSWDSGPLREFDLPDADVDTTGADVTYNSADLETLIERLEVDMRYFEDERAFGEVLYELLASVENSPECDSEGRPDSIRWTLSHYLKLAQRLDDRHGYPLARFWREAVERALIDFDVDEQARSQVDSIELGSGDDHDRDRTGNSPGGATPGD